LQYKTFNKGENLMGWMALAPTGVVMRYTAGVEICIERSHPMEVTTIGLDH
jgi:hypothetical protein